MEDNNEFFKKLSGVLALMFTLVVIFSFVSILKFKEVDNNMNILNNNFVMINSKLNELLNAHNTEVESWYLGNPHIIEVSREFFNRMAEEVANNTQMFNFNTCISELSTYKIFKPNIMFDEDIPYVNGYVVGLFDKKDQSLKGVLTFADKYVIYEIPSCGLVSYNHEDNNLTFNCYDNCGIVENA